MSIKNKNKTHHQEVEGEEERDDAIIGRALRASAAVILVLLVAGGAVAYWVSRPKPEPPIRESVLAPVKVRELSIVQPPQVTFTDVTDTWGIDFVHNNGAVGEKLLPETMGGGCAFFDFDNDGDQDLLFVNSMDWSWNSPGERSQTCALYRNDGQQFVDVTADSGLDVPLYGMGAAVGDFDNDNMVDIFLTAVGSNKLFRNLGGGRFEDVTASAGVAGGEHAWSTSAGWFDCDNDGDLDLFVDNYVQWSREFDQSQDFRLVGGGRAYGRPQNFEGAFPYLYRNEGQGRFTDVSEQSGIQIRNVSTGVPISKSLGLTFCDFDSNGTMDIVVANDTVQNILLQNDGKGSFEDIGTVTGIAFDSAGNARGAMGIDVTPFRDQKSLAVAIGNFSNEMTALYVTRMGEMYFSDEAVSTGLGPNTRLSLTFGLFYIDYDLDGRNDLFCANGHLEEDINRVQPSQHYEQPPQLFWNAGPKQSTEFLQVTQDLVGPDLLKPMVGRGAAYADIDNDGDVDILITAAGRMPRLLRNDNSLGHHWLRIQLKGDGKSCNTDAIGSWVEVTTAEGTQKKQVMPTKSYLSQVELPLTFGLGANKQVENVIVHWSDGHTDELGALEIDKLHVVTRQP